MSPVMLDAQFSGSGTAAMAGLSNPLGPPMAGMIAVTLPTSTEASLREVREASWLGP